MARVIFNGEPGTVFTNEGSTVLYQFIAELKHTCGLCFQYHHAVGPWFPIPLHRSCRCVQQPVYPGKEARPYVDFREVISGLDESQRSKVVGRSNLTLIESGVVKWEDVVSRTRIRDFREVVSREKLTVERMVKAGVQPRQAERAWETVHTPAHELAAEQRRTLLAALAAKGVPGDQVKAAVATRLAARVGIGAGPSGAGKLPVTVLTPTRKAKKPRPEVVTAALKSLGVKEESLRKVVPMPGRVLPGRPIAERLEAYEEGKAKLERILALADVPRKLKDEAARARDEMKAAYAAAERTGDYREAERLTLTFEAAHARASAAVDVQRDEALRVLRVADAIRPDAPASGPGSTRAIANPAIRSIADGAMAFFDGLIGRLPDDADRLGAAWHEMPAGPDQRSYHSRGEIRLGAMAPTSTAVHEFGHNLEHRLPGVRESEVAFWKHRIGDGKPVNLAAKYPSMNFGRDEEGYDGGFAAALTLDPDIPSAVRDGELRGYYAGKKNASGNYELLSTGLETLYNDPVGFARRDPEWFRWVIGVLDGSLR